MKTVWLLIFCGSMTMHAQQKVDADFFFEKGMERQVSKHTRNDTRVYFPWLEEVEVRSETRDLELEQQEYTLRVRPSTIRKRRAQKELYEHLLEARDFAEQESYCDRLEATYMDWIRLYAIQSQLNILKAYEDVWSDRKTIQEREEQTLDFDIDRHVKWQSEYHEFLVLKNELELRKKFILMDYGIFDPILDFHGYPTIDIIRQLLEKDMAPLNADLELQHEKEQIEKELALEMAEKNQILDFAQIRYRGPHDDLWSERVAVGIGIRLPMMGKDKFKIQKLHIEKEEISEKLKLEMEKKNEELSSIKNELLLGIKKYTFFSEIIRQERKKLISLNERIESKQGFNPYFSLEIEEIHMRKKLKKSKMIEGIFLDYIEYLSLSEDLCRRPFVNFLK